MLWHKRNFRNLPGWGEAGGIWVGPSGAYEPFANGFKRTPPFVTVGLREREVDEPAPFYAILEFIRLHNKVSAHGVPDALAYMQ